MTTFGIVWIVVMSLGFAICGWLFVFKTNMMVELGRKNYEKSKFIQASRLSSMVLKPSYPTYIRCAGIFIWLWDLFIIYIVLTKKLR